MIFLAMTVAIIGKGNVGYAIAKGLKDKHEIRFGHRDPNAPVFQAAAWGEIILLAVPYDSASAVAKEVGSAADGKPVLDVSNAIGTNGDLGLGFSTSGAEELQKKLPKAHLVKAFNTVFAKNQSTGKIGDEQLTLFVAAEDTKAKQTVMQLGRDIGFDSVDAG